MVLGTAGPKKVIKAAATTGKSARYYPADDIAVPKHSRKTPKVCLVSRPFLIQLFEHFTQQSDFLVSQPTKVRESIIPGTVLIILAGRFRGKRAVCLKALPSGLLLISGPYKINGIPLRRVNQAYVIATSTKVNVSGVDVSAISDEFFARAETAGKDAEEEFFEGENKAAIVSDERKAAQKAVDAKLLKAVEKVPMLKGYLNSKFSLKRGDRPHNMVF